MLLCLAQTPPRAILHKLLHILSVNPEDSVSSFLSFNLFVNLLKSSSGRELLRVTKSVCVSVCLLTIKEYLGSAKDGPTCIFGRWWSHLHTQHRVYVCWHLASRIGTEA